MVKTVSSPLVGAVGEKKNSIWLADVFIYEMAASPSCKIAV